MEPIIRREDVVAHDYEATKGNYFIDGSQLTARHNYQTVPRAVTLHPTSQLSHHSRRLVTINASHSGPITASNISDQTSQQLHRLTSEVANASKQQSHGDRTSTSWIVGYTENYIMMYSIVLVAFNCLLCVTDEQTGEIRKLPTGIAVHCSLECWSRVVPYRAADRQQTQIRQSVLLSD